MYILVVKIYLLYNSILLEIYYYTLLYNEKFI